MNDELIIDFNEDHYCEILKAAQKNYVFANYGNIPWDTKFVLWRHDVDYSLNRSLRIAELEYGVGVTSTFFVDLHSPFYNPLEKNQSHLIHEILNMGHQLGIHFDASYYDLKSASEVAEPLRIETKLIERYFSTTVAAMSFHNPTTLHLSWDQPAFAGLVNCYCCDFRDTITYVSDSNGYWRYSRLFDVVSQAHAPRLQVLTHPGHWQATSMFPRERILRSVYGRAIANMSTYDQLLKTSGRQNYSSIPDDLRELSEKSPDRFAYIDFLWFHQRYESLLNALLQDQKQCERDLDLHRRSDPKIPALYQTDSSVDVEHGEVDTDLSALIESCRASARIILRNLG